MEDYEDDGYLDEYDYNRFIESKIKLIKEKTDKSNLNLFEESEQKSHKVDIKHAIKKYTVLIVDFSVPPN